MSLSTLNPFSRSFAALFAGVLDNTPSPPELIALRKLPLVWFAVEILSEIPWNDEEIVIFGGFWRDLLTLVYQTGATPRFADIDLLVTHLLFCENDDGTLRDLLIEELTKILKKKYTGKFTITPVYDDGLNGLRDAATPTTYEDPEDLVVEKANLTPAGFVPSIGFTHATYTIRLDDGRSIALDVSPSTFPDPIAMSGENLGMRACCARCIAQPTTFHGLVDVLKSNLFSTHAKLGVEAQLAHLRFARLGYYGPLTEKAKKRIDVRVVNGFDVKLFAIEALCGGDDADGNVAAVNVAAGNVAAGNVAAEDDWSSW